MRCLIYAFNRSICLELLMFGQKYPAVVSTAEAGNNAVLVEQI